MLTSIVRELRWTIGLLAAALLLQWLVVPAGADELADFHAAVAQASAQYRVALTTLETKGQNETAAEVSRFRESWHAVMGATRPVAFADDESYVTTFLDVDLQIVGILMVIDMGNRDSARDALLSIGQTLARLSDRSTPTAH